MSTEQTTRSGPAGVWAGRLRSVTGVVDAVRGRLRRIPGSRVGVWVRRHTNVYRSVAELTDSSVLGAVGGAWALWLVGALLSAVMGTPAWVRVPVGVLGGLALAGVSVAVLVWWTGYRLSPAQLRHDLLGREGTARHREIERAMGEAAVEKAAQQVRPTLAAAGAARAVDAGWLLGTSRATGVWSCCELPVYMLGTARSGKGVSVVVPSIIDAPGAVVVTSTRADNMETTITMRARRGPVYLFDPEVVTGRPSTMKVDLFAGCVDPAVAQRYAQTLVARTGMSGENAPWATSSGGIVQALLHAAAISGASIHDLHRWSKDPTLAAEAMQVLRAGSSEGWDQTIRTVIGEDPRMRSSKWFGVQNAFAGLDVAAVRDMFDVEPGDPEAFDPTRFLLSSGTLYVVSRWRAEETTGGSVGGFYSLVLDQIAEAARTLAQTGSGRLEPPCLMLLDELANIHPWPAVVRAMTAGSGEGLQVMVVFQSRSQAAAAFGDKAEQTMWDQAVALVLGGSMDEDALSDLSTLLGQRHRTRRERSWQSGQVIGGASTSERVAELAVISPAELRRLPEGVVLAVPKRARPIVVDTLPWWRRPWAGDVAASRSWHREHPGETFEAV